MWSGPWRREVRGGRPVLSWPLPAAPWTKTNLDALASICPVIVSVAARCSESLRTRASSAWKVIVAGAGVEGGVLPADCPPVDCTVTGASKKASASARSCAAAARRKHCFSSAAAVDGAIPRSRKSFMRCWANALYSVTGLASRSRSTTKAKRSWWAVYRNSTSSCRTRAASSSLANMPVASMASSYVGYCEPLCDWQSWKLLEEGGQT
eukprot:9503789-Pyramimonas_sp.AAC.1